MMGGSVVALDMWRRPQRLPTRHIAIKNELARRRSRPVTSRDEPSLRGGGSRLHCVRTFAHAPSVMPPENCSDKERKATPYAAFVPCQLQSKDGATDKEE
eukprot:2350719-Pleurochrysis_carterae.AAC.2